jgi:hypothetical protein
MPSLAKKYLQLEAHNIYIYIYVETYANTHIAHSVHQLGAPIDIHLNSVRDRISKFGR